MASLIQIYTVRLLTGDLDVPYTLGDREVGVQIDRYGNLYAAAAETMVLMQKLSTEDYGAPWQAEIKRLRAFVALGRDAPLAPGIPDVDLQPSEPTQPDHQARQYLFVQSAIAVPVAADFLGSSATFSDTEVVQIPQFSGPHFVLLARPVSLGDLNEFDNGFNQAAGFEKIQDLTIAGVVCQVYRTTEAWFDVNAGTKATTG